jgi:hypothetical protein
MVDLISVVYIVAWGMVWVFSDYSNVYEDSVRLAQDTVSFGEWVYPRPESS